MPGEITSQGVSLIKPQALLETLPPELTSLILTHLPIRTLWTLRRLSKPWMVETHRVIIDHLQRRLHGTPSHSPTFELIIRPIRPGCPSIIVALLCRGIKEGRIVFSPLDEWVEPGWSTVVSSANPLDMKMRGGVWMMVRKVDERGARPITRSTMVPDGVGSVKIEGMVVKFRQVGAADEMNVGGGAGKIQYIIMDGRYLIA